MSVTINDIKYFIKVSETKNVTRASEILGVTQPTLSYALKRLENELGGELIIRLKTGVQLTKLGEDFLTRSRQLAYQWEQAQKAVDPDNLELNSKYVFAIHPSVALYSFKHFIPRISNMYPNIEFDFIHGLSREMTEKVISWEADFGLVINPIKHPDLVIIKLCTDEVGVYGVKNHKDKLIYDPQLMQTQSILKKLSKKLTEKKKSLTSENLEVAAELTALGEGLGILPSRVAAKHPQLKLQEGWPQFKDSLCLVYRSEKHRNNPVSTSIIECIKNSNI